MSARCVIRTVGRGAGVKAYAVDGTEVEAAKKDAAAQHSENPASHACSNNTAAKCTPQNMPKPHYSYNNLPHRITGGSATSDSGAPESSTAPLPNHRQATATLQINRLAGTARDPSSTVRTFRGKKRRRTRFTPVLPVIYEDSVLV